MSLKERRQKLANLVDFPVILWSGGRLSRNFPANVFPFRASSHFLYFSGLPLENAAIRLESGKMELFLDDHPPGHTLWHGPRPTRAEIAEMIGADGAWPMDELKNRAAGVGSIPVQDFSTQLIQAEILDRALSPTKSPQGMDLKLTQAIINLRLTHDDTALQELQKAADVTVTAHQAGIAATPTAKTEADIRAAMECSIMRENCTCSYQSIVTTHGEILHNEHYNHSLKPGDLLLADVGAETPTGWAGDVTRTWPVSGKFSPTQRDIYDVVLAAHDLCISQVKPGQEYMDIHLLAALTIAEGLVNLNILQGQPESLVEQDAHALFFPHGIGHLLGLDVHDMEDLGDLAGYEENRVRSERFGLGFLRLNRPLKERMLVTIEPGFYQVPAILNDPENRAKYHNMVNWEQLAKFADVPGIRIEDDVLVTAEGNRVLTSNLPTHAEKMEF